MAANRKGSRWVTSPQTGDSGAAWDDSSLAEPSRVDDRRRAAEACPFEGPLAEGTVVNGRYTIRMPIGGGACATVYEAEQVHNGKLVAIKVLAPDDEGGDQWQARFARETRVMAMLAHPNICQIHDWGVLQDGRPYYVMELLEGEPLARRIKLARKMPIVEALDVAIQVAAGLRAAHMVAIVHRDVKPENIFLVRTGDHRQLAKLLDFGLCKDLTRCLRPAEDTTQITRTGLFVGTPSYMAPEQVNGAQAVDARADLWSVGVVLYEMVTGRRPFSAPNMALTLVRIGSEDPLPLATYRPDVPPLLQQVIDRALQKDPDRRYQKASSFMRDLIEVRRVVVEQSVSKR